MRITAFFIHFLCILSFALAQQPLPHTPDTLIQEHFDTDPSAAMLPTPGGQDTRWVNYDEDKRPHIDSLPGNWYWDIDLVDTAHNDCFTSASYLKTFTRNRNWLILPKTRIPDSSYWFCWRSQPFEGPGYMDGYRILVSTTSNIPLQGGFKDTLFTGAETVGLPQIPSLNLSDFTFTRGYIHAEAFTDPNYYFIVNEQLPNGAVFQYYRCIFEPHAVSLAQYAGKEIFIAILHDSFRDNVLQIDDILVAKHKTSDAREAPSSIRSFQVLSDGQQSAIYLRWTLDVPREHQVFFSDMQGRIFGLRRFKSDDTGLLHCDTSTMAPGMYAAVLQTADGKTMTKRFVCPSNK